MGRFGDKFGRVLGKYLHTGRGEEGAYEEAQRGDAGGHKDGEFDHALEAIVAPRAEVETCDGLQTLVETDDDKHDKHQEAVGNAECAHGNVAAVLGHRARDDDSQQAGTGIDEELRQTDCHRIAHDAEIGAYLLALQVDELTAVGEEAKLPHQHTALGQNRGKGGSADAPTQNEDEEGSQDDVDNDGAEGGIHGLLGPIGGAEHGVEAQVKVGDHIARKDNGHKVVGIGQGVVARAEKAQDGREEGLKHKAEDKAHGHVHNKYVAKDALRRMVIFLPQTNTHQCGCAYTDHRAKGGGERHDGIGQRQAHDSLLAHALAYEDAVHYIIQGGGGHGNDGWDGILHEQAAYGLFA